MKKILLSLLLMLSSLSAVDNLKKCKTCHGSEFQLKALASSKIVKDFTLQELKTALMGYKDKTYGGNMKHLMVAQIAMIKKDEINELANSIYLINNPKPPKDINVSQLPSLEKASNFKLNGKYCGKNCTCRDSNKTTTKEMSFKPNKRTNKEAYKRSIEVQK